MRLLKIQHFPAASLGIVGAESCTFETNWKGIGSSLFPHSHGGQSVPREVAMCECQAQGLNGGCGGLFLAV